MLPDFIETAQLFLSRNMSAASDAESESQQEAEEEADYIVNVLSKHPVLLSKSSTPVVKKKKEAAIAALCAELEMRTGKLFETGKTSKKIANMKTRMKGKVDRNRTGNRPIKLLPWESRLARIMDADSNPTMSQTPGASAAGFQASATVVSPQPADERRSPSVQPKEPARKRRMSGETEETEKLGNADLQRLVLLEQLRYVRLKRRLVMESQASRPALRPPSYGNGYQD